MNRRDFLTFGGRTMALLALLPGAALGACQRLSAIATDSARRTLLRIGPTVSPDDLTLVARTALVQDGGVESAIWTFGDGPTGPTIAAERGEPARILLRNDLPEPTIVHWHGFRPPEAADGHPRLAIPPGGVYSYDFTVDEPAGLYWYHPHPHHRTGHQTYLGMAGLFIVRDEVEAALGLPTGDRELPLLIQDRQLDQAGHIIYEPRGHDLMEGYLGGTAYVNGIREPRMEVDAAVYRLRILCAANARIMRLALSDGRPLTVIGGDVGFLPEPVTLPFVDLGSAERIDVLVDFSDLDPGQTVTLKSLAFEPPTGGMGMGMMGGGRMNMGGMGAMGSGLPQGAELEILEFEVVRAVRDASRPSPALPHLAPAVRSTAVRERTFHFESMMMRHSIDGRTFAMDRIDERVRLGDTEAWTFVNDSPFPHSVHLHATHFRVLSRSGGRNEVLPWERGLKDTVLVLPGERVEVLAPFDRHAGRYLIHCHNLEHEDMDMMLNFEIVAD